MRLVGWLSEVESGMIWGGCRRDPIPLVALGFWGGESGAVL